MECPDCRNHFVQPFVCITCGAQKLYDETVRTQAAEIERLKKALAESEERGERKAIAAARQVSNHVCGLQGFGRGLGSENDVCRGCTPCVHVWEVSPYTDSRDKCSKCGEERLR